MFFTILGTGQLYKATGLTQHEIQFARADSTKFFGYNFWSFDFSFHDSIFSFGGYGFWRSNGHLRYFNALNEWSILPLDNEFEHIYPYIFLEPESSNVYYIQTPHVNEATGKRIDTYKVFCLSLNKKTVVQLGEVTAGFSKQLAEGKYVYSIPSLKGLLFQNNTGFYLLQFEKNKIYKLKSKNVFDKILGKSQSEVTSVFEHSGKLYIYSINENSLRSVSISLADFDDTELPVYAKMKQGPGFLLLTIFGISILIISAYFLRKYFRRINVIRRQLIPALSLPETDNAGSQPLFFNEIEKSVINAFILHPEPEKILTVEDLNKILGLSKKSLEIQKKIRRELINNINYKFRIMFDQETDLIETERSHHDRRYFNYFIRKENIKLFNNKPINGNL